MVGQKSCMPLVILHYITSNDRHLCWFSALPDTGLSMVLVYTSEKGRCSPSSKSSRRDRTSMRNSGRRNCGAEMSQRWQRGGGLG